LAPYSRVKQEEDEILMIELANAISHPGAVVVHSQNTPVADSTVMNSLFLDEIAFGAVSYAI
jgi:hypothetical protein